MVSLSLRANLGTENAGSRGDLAEAAGIGESYVGLSGYSTRPNVGSEPVRIGGECVAKEV